MTWTEQQIIRIVSDSLGRPVQPTDSWDDLGVDSISMAVVLSEVETKFGVRLDERAFEFDTVAEMAEYLDSKLPQVSEAS